RRVALGHQPGTASVPRSRLEHRATGRAARPASRQRRGGAIRPAYSRGRPTCRRARSADYPGRGRHAAVPPGRGGRPAHSTLGRDQALAAGGPVSRVIRKSSAQSSTEVQDLLSGLFSLELIRPSTCLWLVSPWISDVKIIDNTAATFPTLARFGQRRV